MAKLLYITANPKDVSDSNSLMVGEEFLAAYAAQNPGDEIEKLDLFAADLQEIDADILSAWGKFGPGTGDSDTAVERGKVQKMGATLEQFLAADKYVFVTPMWNYSLPPRVKTYIDSLFIPNKTFKYTETGPVGMLEGKKAVHVHSTGDVYSQGPSASMNFGDPYLKAVLGYLGVKDYSAVLIEGTKIFPTEAEAIREKAVAQARGVAKSF
ncbi:FMN-dependent NADH-azoreductase [Paraliobacillus sediminis]|uniref:FMN-dependent NADH-azoreductase n=1 Tax=Paraliobacillus sediminis TaxID=1885916 RepID=UPI000E3E8163|nr:FMN-dependent NADH-azoreductase [Paraliobacillus sediminis]